MRMSHSMIYFIENISSVDESDLKELLPYIPAEEMKSIYGYRFPKNRVQSILAYLLLRYGLMKEYNISYLPYIERTEFGKPYFPDFSHVHFNFSHCNSAVACGLASSSIGVDVQHVVKVKSSVVKHHMTSEEQHEILAGDMDLVFTRLWSRKESYGKYLGKGIRYKMADFSVLEDSGSFGANIFSYEMDGYFLSVCCKNEPSLVKISLSQLKNGITQGI